MPRLIRLYIRHVIIGFALGAGFVAILLALDVAGLRNLLLGSPAGWLAAGMMVVANGIVFSGVQFGIAIMNMAQNETPPRGGRKIRAASGAPLVQAVPVRDHRKP